VYWSSQLGGAVQGSLGLDRGCAGLDAAASAAEIVACARARRLLPRWIDPEEQVALRTMAASFTGMSIIGP